MHQKKWSVLALAVICVSLGAASGHAATIATFADPTIGSGPPPYLFDVNTTTSTITGGWSGTGLTLETRVGTFTDVQFFLPAVQFDASFVTGPGSIEFRESDNDLLFRIAFTEAVLDNPFSFGATELVGTGEIIFSGPAIDPPGAVDGTETFSFPFANQTSTANGYMATASFTSSAALVPEPATLASLIVLTVFAGRRGRRRA